MEGHILLKKHDKCYSSKNALSTFFKQHLVSRNHHKQAHLSFTVTVIYNLKLTPPSLCPLCSCTLTSSAPASISLSVSHLIPLLLTLSLILIGHFLAWLLSSFAPCLFLWYSTLSNYQQKTLLVFQVKLISSLNWKGGWGQESNLLSDFVATQPSQWPWPSVIHGEF